ncbi:MAG: peptidoglycan editing factor PgeF [Lachnospiraceae bacterium]|nr:peptidoglycan editing factor PgeF [Lachnospiraceae bacterium]
MIKMQRKEGQGVCRLRKAENGVTYLTFPGLERTGVVRHLFSTRMGGVSEGIYASMNLSYTRGDEKEAVDENYHRIAACLDSKVEDMVCSDQTHTDHIRLVTAEDKGKGVIRPKDYRDVDGLITQEKGIVLCTFYADCVPLFFVDPVKKAIGLSHSGWRGTVQKIGKKTVEEMGKAFGTDPKDVRAAIGPSICQDCYEVSEDVIEEFRKAFPEAAAGAESLEFPGLRSESRGRVRLLWYPTKPGKYQLDLWEANRQIMLEAGIPETQIEVTDLCTCCNPDLLFSHRASHGKRGNLGAFMKLV